MDNTCKTCDKEATGYKCADCGAESEEHDEVHGCGSDRCQPKCSECKEAEDNCTCPVIQKG